MTVITPQSDVYLLKVPLEIDNTNQLTFANATAQHTYFASLPKIGYDDFTYVRKDGVLRIPAVMDDILSYNYVMYRNDAYSSKWFYAYITGIEYVNDSVTDVSIATDTFQTWQFDLVYKRTFVEREHVNDDTIGANLMPEGLELGEYVANPIPYNNTTTDKRDVGFTSTKCYVINSIYNPKGGSTKYLFTNVNGVPVSGGLWIFEHPANMQNALIQYSNDGRLDTVTQVYMLPRYIFNDNELEADELPNVQDPDASLYYRFKGKSDAESLTHSFTIPSSLNGYVPRNKKLFTAPYSFMEITNNNGTTASYNYEYFSNKQSMVICTKGSASVGGSIIVYPNNYKNIVDNYNEGILAGKFPTLSWSGDSYTNWLTQNAVNISTGIIGDLAGSALSAVSGHFLATKPAEEGLSYARSGIGLFNGISSTLGQMYQHSIAPYTSKGNINGGDVLSGEGVNSCYLSQMSITYQFAAKIDSYFDRFGYKVGETKIPNVTGRRNWNFVKTIGCYIEADIPQDDLQQIKEMFNKGITFWHNPSTFCDYSQNNDII